MYPTIKDIYRLKGCSGNFFLINLNTFEEYSINDLQAEVLSLCNGSNDVDNISNKFSLEKEDLLEFLLEQQNLNVITLKNEQCSVKNNWSDLLRIKPPYLREVHFDITSKCPRSCPICYQEPYLNNKTISDYNTQEIKVIIDKLSEINITKLVISGGEPFSRLDLSEVVEYAFSKGIVVPTIFTSGTILNWEMVGKIINLRKPITFAISLDGFNQETNDFIRDSGSYLKTVKFVNYLLANKKINNSIKIVIDTIVHPFNYKNFNEFFWFLVDLGVDRWRVALPRDQGAYSKNKNSLSVDIKDVLLAYENFIIWYLNNNIKDKQALDIQIESFFRTSFLQGKKPNLFSKDSRCCEYKVDALTIKPNGDVTACTAFTNLVLGNLHDKNISEIWYSNECQSVKNIKISSLEECFDCKYMYICGGGCRTIALRKTGNLLAKDESACDIYKFFDEKIIPILNKYDIDLI